MEVSRMGAAGAGKKKKETAGTVRFEVVGKMS